MQVICCTLISLFLLFGPQTVTVSGRILNRDGKPASNAKVFYANPSAHRDYAGKTDAQGKFVLVGVAPGSYQVTITDQKGKKIFSGKKDVWAGADNQTNPNVAPDNVLNVDLSKAGSAKAGTAAASAQGQGDLLGKKNADALKNNQLVAQLRKHMDAKDWQHAAETLQQLIALNPNRWQFYQNLGAMQNNLAHYEDAAHSFAKGVEVAKATLAHEADPAKATAAIGGMLLAEGDDYNRINNLDQAVTVYNQAASMFPQPAPAYYRLCNALASHRNATAAIEACNQAITADPKQWGYYQLLASSQIMAGKKQDALQTYDKGADVARKALAGKDSDAAKSGLGQMLTAKGNLYSQMEKYDEAIAAFKEAATSFENPAIPYYNLCATYYNLKRMDDAVAACDKAIAGNAKMAEAYYIKGSALYSLGRLEYGKYVAPMQTRAVLNKYLEVAPKGPHAEAVHGMLDKLGPDLEAGKKHKKKH